MNTYKVKIGFPFFLGFIGVYKVNRAGEREGALGYLRSSVAPNGLVFHA